MIPITSSQHRHNAGKRENGETQEDEEEEEEEEEEEDFVPSFRTSSA